MPEPTTPLVERPWEDVERMLDVDSALERVLSAFSPLQPVMLPLLDAALPFAMVWMRCSPPTMPPIQPPVHQSTTGQPCPQAASPTARTFCCGK